MFRVNRRVRSFNAGTPVELEDRRPAITIRDISRRLRKEQPDRRVPSSKLAMGRRLSHTG